MREQKGKTGPLLADLSDQEAAALCRELREELIRDVSRTGGHLASNLGAVELTVAIHRVFDTSRDRLVFDVGHQCYIHKMLTGRREEMAGLRQYGGIAAFPSPGRASTTRSLPDTPQFGGGGGWHGPGTGRPGPGLPGGRPHRRRAPHRRSGSMRDCPTEDSADSSCWSF